MQVAAMVPAGHCLAAQAICVGGIPGARYCDALLVLCGNGPVTTIASKPLSSKLPLATLASAIGV